MNPLSEGGVKRVPVSRIGKHPGNRGFKESSNLSIHL